LNLTAPEPQAWKVRQETKPSETPAEAADAPAAPDSVVGLQEGQAADAEAETIPHDAEAVAAPEADTVAESPRRAARGARRVLFASNSPVQPAAETSSAPEAPVSEPPVSERQVSERQVSAAPVATGAAPEPAPARAPAPASARGGEPAKGGLFSWLVNPYFVVLVMAVAWASGVGAYVVGYQGWGAFDFTPFRVIVLVLLAVAPIPLMFFAAQLMRRSAQLAAETRRVHAATQAMVGPATLAATQTVEVVKSLREEIVHAVQSAERARAELAALRDALSLQNRELDAACAHASLGARATVEALSREREQMGELGQGLDRQAASVINAIERQAHMVRDASDLAQTQLREAEAALAARAADLAAAAGEAQDAARLASDDLARQTLRLETAGAGVAEQIRSVEEGLSQQRAALVQGAYQLRADQEDFSAQVETQRAQMVEVLSAARAAAGELGEASTRGAEALAELMQAAGRQFGELAVAAEGERAGFEARVRDALERFAATAAEARDRMAGATSQSLAALTSATDAARVAADAAAEAARARVDGLGQAAFEAGRRAEDAYEARMAAARKLIEESANLVEAAGKRTAGKIEADLAAMTQAVGQIGQALSEIDGRAARLPEEAKARIDEIRSAVEQGLDALAAATRRAAQETQAADADFHERVRRNYEMLTEAVRLMGVVSGETPLAHRREEPVSDLLSGGLIGGAATAADAASDAADAAGLRGKLRLTRHTNDAEVRNLFDAPPPRGESEGWTWRDLLGGIEAGKGPVTADDGGLTLRMLDEIKGLGVDPKALLPRSRVDEAVQAWLTGDAAGARQVVRRVAPAAVRRISRRILTDKPLRAQAERYVARYVGLIGEAGGAGPLSDLLSAEAGRTFLLIDAATGDAGA
jgi:hypothetical protein